MPQGLSAYRPTAYRARPGRRLTQGRLTEWDDLVFGSVFGPGPARDPVPVTGRRSRQYWTLGPMR